MVWHIISLCINSRLIIVSPLEAFLKLVEIAKTSDFRISVLYSSFRILSGLLLGTALAAVFAVMSHTQKAIRELISPFLATVKAVPVASFIVILLIWLKKSLLVTAVSSLVVLPVIYNSTLAGLDNADKQILETAKVFGLSKIKIYKEIYSRQLKPYLISSMDFASGLCWKAGVAAEIIGLPDKAVGTKLYTAKLYLDTESLFAWTITIVILSAVFRKAVTAAVSLITGKRCKNEAHKNK